MTKSLVCATVEEEDGRSRSKGNIDVPEKTTNDEINEQEVSIDGLSLALEQATAKRNKWRAIINGMNHRVSTKTSTLFSKMEEMYDRGDVVGNDDDDDDNDNDRFVLAKDSTIAEFRVTDNVEAEAESQKGYPQVHDGDNNDGDNNDGDNNDGDHSSSSTTSTGPIEIPEEVNGILVLTEGGLLSSLFIS